MRTLERTPALQGKGCALAPVSPAFRFAMLTPANPNRSWRDFTGGTPDDDDWGGGRLLR